MEGGCNIHVLEYFDKLPRKMFLQVKNKACHGQPYFLYFCTITCITTQLHKGQKNTKNTHNTKKQKVLHVCFCYIIVKVLCSAKKNKLLKFPHDKLLGKMFL